MISRHLQKFTGILISALQSLKKIRALIQCVIPEPDHQIVGLEVIALDQFQGFLRPWAELRHHSEGWGDGTQQRNRAISSEIIEAQGCQALTAPPSIRCQEVQFAAQAVTQAKGCEWMPQALLEALTALTQLLPCFSRLQLMVETGDIAPGMNGQLISSQ